MLWVHPIQKVYWFEAFELIFFLFGIPNRKFNIDCVPNPENDGEENTH